MKKLLAVATFFILISCSHQNQKVSFNLSFNDNKLSVENGSGINIAVIDDRLEKKILGTKEFCNDDKITISSDENLTELLQQKISENLAQKGFKKGRDKVLAIHLSNLQYSAKCGLIIGKSSADIAIKVVITDYKSGSEITKNFDLSLNSKHLFRPLESTDSQTINNLLQEMVSDILKDEALLKNLSQ